MYWTRQLAGLAFAHFPIRLHVKRDNLDGRYYCLRMSQNNVFFKNDIPSSESDVGARGYGIVVFEAVTTIPYSGRNNFNYNKTGRNDGIS